MMILITIVAFLVTILLVVAAYYLFSSQPQQVVVQRLEQIRVGSVGGRTAAATAAREAAERGPRDPMEFLVSRVLRPIGQMLGRSGATPSGLRRKLMQAGYYSENAVLTYTGIKVLLAAALPLLAILVLSQFGISLAQVIFVLPISALVGFVFPSIVLTSKISNRKLLIRNGLADALDLMVSCVEAGLSLNAALQRVSQELRTAHPDVSQEFDICGLEIRTGKPREEALRNLGDRCGVKDMKSFTAMLIQTDRFGTSIARALRVFSDTLRTKRRQRAEEAAAQTTVKLVFPLIFFIFPTILIVLLGPGVIQVIEVLRPAMRK
jgi:tight adherence protein C